MEQKTIVVGMLDLKGWIEHGCRVFSAEGVAPTVVAGGGSHITKIIEYED